MLYLSPIWHWSVARLKKVRIVFYTIELLFVFVLYTYISRMSNKHTCACVGSRLCLFVWHFVTQRCQYKQQEKKRISLTLPPNKITYWHFVIRHTNQRASKRTNERNECCVLCNAQHHAPSVTWRSATLMSKKLTHVNRPGGQEE